MKITRAMQSISCFIFLTSAAGAQQGSFEETLCRATAIPRAEQLFYLRDAQPIEEAMSLAFRSNERVIPFLLARVQEIYSDPDLAEQGMTSGGWLTLCIFDVSR